MATARKNRLSQEQFEQIARALADPKRFSILQQVAQCKCETGYTPCSALKAHECLSPATISHHLKELQESGLIDVAREGRTAKLTLRREVWDAYVSELQTL
ncbi:ArsR/SmtB family transcription factor [Granulicella cerasi]|uniref:ArsR/SmtB family transcription factor n=1 Tax=Granulicella cerasi TaxID=741063 RepID=A0ABW1Z9B7_9BACT|nr:helix-turn-helix domain-containing protein [Granulicella cerasi]